MATTTQQKTYGVKEIAKLFPSLMKIKQKSLREKVAAVWNEAITTGCGGKGWTFAELRAVKFTLLAGDIDMRFVENLNSCALQCIAIADVLKRAFRCSIPIQRDYLIAGALLADVGKERTGDEIIALDGNAAAERTLQDVRDRDALKRAGVKIFDKPHVDVAGQQGELDRSKFGEGPAFPATAGRDRLVPHRR